LESGTFTKTEGLSLYQDLALTLGVHPSAIGVYGDGNGSGHHMEILRSPYILYISSRPTLRMTLKLFDRLLHWRPLSKSSLHPDRGNRDSSQLSTTTTTIITIWHGQKLYPAIVATQSPQGGYYPPCLLDYYRFRILRPPMAEFRDHEQWTQDEKGTWVLNNSVWGANSCAEWAGYGRW
jgi:hypothetical protein